MPRPRYKRIPDDQPQHGALEVPVVLPRVVMVLAANGTMTVTVDGAPHGPEPFAPPWRRESFAHVVDQLTTQHRSPLRVEVHEADGTVFTDIITPPGRQRRPEPEAVPEATAAARAVCRS